MNGDKITRKQIPRHQRGIDFALSLCSYSCLLNSIFPPFLHGGGFGQIHEAIYIFNVNFIYIEFYFLILPPNSLYLHFLHRLTHGRW